MPDIRFVQPGGIEKVVKAKVGHSVMEAARRGGVSGIDAECGGAAICATCHVIVRNEWVGAFPEPSANEQLMLDLALDRQPNSRLSCQLKVDERHDGLLIEVAKRQGMF